MKTTAPHSLNRMLLRLLLWRLFLPALILGLLFMGVMGYLEVRSLGTRQRQLARSLARRADDYLEHAGRVVDAMARTVEMEGPQAAASLQAAWEAYGHFDTLYRLDQRGVVTALAPSNPRYQGVDMSHQPYFRQAADQTEVAISQPFLSARTGQPTVYVTRWLQGGGMLVGELSLEALQAAVTPQGDETGEQSVFITDRFGTLLAHPRLELVAQQENVGHLEIVRRGLGGQAVLIYTADGRWVLGGAVPMERSDWLVVVQTPLTAVYGPRLGMAALFFTFMVLIGLAVVGYFRQQLQRHIVAPLARLGRRADALAAGGFTETETLMAIPTPFAEIGELAADFQRMSQAIQAREEALRKVNRALETLSLCNQALVRATNESALLHEVCQIIVEAGGYRLAWVGFAEQNEQKTVHPVAQSGFEDGYLETIHTTWADTEHGRGPTGTAIRTGAPAIAKNILTNPDFAPWREEATQRGYASSIALPLVAENRTFGALNVYAIDPDAFDAEGVDLLMDLADDLAYGITVLRTRADYRRAEEERIRLFAAERSRRQELDSLYALSRQLVATDEIEAILDSVVRHTTESVHVTFCRLVLLEDEAFVCRAAYPLRVLEFDLRVGRAEPEVAWPHYQRLLEGDEPLVLERDDSTLNREEREALLLDAVHSLCLAPLRAGDEIIGVMILGESRSPAREPFDADKLSLAVAIADQAAGALHRASLFSATREHAEMMGRLVPISETLNRPLTTDEVVAAIGKGTLALSAADRAALYFREPDDTVTCLWSHALSTAYLEQVTARAQEMPGGRLLEQTEPVFVGDTEQVPADSLVHGLAEAEGYRAMSMWPLVYEGQSVAAVGCYYDAPHTCLPGHRQAWSEVEQEMMEAFCRQSAIALENARLFEETRQRQEELAALYQTSLEIASESVDHAQIQPLLERVVERATDLLAGDGGSLYLVDPGRQSATCVVSYRTPDDYTGVTLQQGEGAAGKVLETGEPLIIDDYRVWSGQAAAFKEDQPFQAVISAPLKWAGQVVGVLHVLDHGEARCFDEDDLQMLELFAHHAATTIEYSQRLEAERRWAVELETLHQAALDITAELGPSKLLETIVQRAAELLGAKGGGIYLYDADRQELELVLSHNLARDYTGTRLSLGEGLSGKVVEQRRPITVDDYRTWPGRAQEQYGDAPFTAIIAAPLQVGDRILGVLNITDEVEDRVFGADDVHLVTLFAAQAAVALENARLYEDLEEVYVETVLALSNAMDARDTYTANHSQRLAEWATVTAREMGCSEEEIETLRWATLLHDIGKIGVPDRVLLKPDSLNNEERATMELHPEIGEQIMAPVKKLAGVAPIIRAHQERWDGTGYPDGLSGETIPLEARILAVVDAYGAMTEDRVYREARSHEAAVAELKKCAGAQFDPQMVEAFLRVLERE